jgi:putative ABC transport system substrate-binding protein
MRRRDLIAALGGAALTRALPAQAQRAKRLPVVAIVSSIPLDQITGPEPVNRPVRAFIEGLRDLGWIEGRTIALLRRSAVGGPERVAATFGELIASGVDVIFLGGASWLHTEAWKATRTIPLVALFGDDPVAAGFASSLARPGGNITGVTRHAGPEIHGKWLELLRELAPGISRTAFLATGDTLEAFRRAALPVGSTVVPVQVDVAEQIDTAFAAVVRERADSLMVTTGPQFHQNARRIADFAAERNLPGLYAIREVVEAGGLMSYGPNVLAQFRHAARHVDQILKGAKPADLPIEQPTRFDLVINARTAKALGLTIPPAILLRADEVIE